MSSNEYVEGDVNQLDDETLSNGESSALSATAVLEYIAQSMADDPSAVAVEVDERGGKVSLSLRVGPEDIGRVIGRRGRTAQAIRAVVAAAGARDGVTTSVDILD